MSRIDFYEAKGRGWEVVLCRLVEAAYAEGNRVYVWANSEVAARRLDELLWTFRDDAFVPHGLWQGEAEFDESVSVGWKRGNPNTASCLVLAKDASAEEVREFERVIDLAPVDVPSLLQAARRRYRVFRDAGHDVQFHPADPPRAGSG